MTNVDQGETPPDRLLDLIVSTPLEEFPFEEFLDTSYSEEVWDAIPDGSDDKVTSLVCEVYDKISPASKVHKRKRRVDPSEKRPRSKRSKRGLIPPLTPKSSETPGFNTSVQEGDFHLTGLSSLVHLPLTIATTASLMPSGAPAMQIIQTFNPLSPPVIKSILPVGHTYVLVSPQSLAPVPVPQIAPLSPLDGTVAPIELSMSIQPVSSLSDSASRSQSPSQTAPVSPSKDKSPSKEHLPATQEIKKIPVIPKNVQDFIKRLKLHLGETCSMMQGGMSMESHYIDTPLVQRKLVIRTGKNANKCLEKELVVLSDSERKKAMMHRSHVFQNCGSNNKHLITVLGKAGMGKSTFIQRLALDWSSGGLQQFQFIFLLNCKVLNLTQRSFSLKSLLFDSSTSPRCDDSEAIFKHVLSFPENVLIVFDSFDEMKDLEGLLQSPATSATDGNYSIRQLFSGLFQKKILSGCTVLIVTRPKDVLNQLLRKVDGILEVSCFSPKDIETYVSNYFEDASEKKDAFRKIQNQRYIFSLCSNPLLCRLTCFLAEHQKSSGLPSTLTDLYQRVLGQYLEQNGELQGSKQELVQLCNVAWDGFKTQNSLLNQNQNQNLVDYGLTSGILITHTGSEEPDNSRVTYFANLFVQNFLSALLLVHSNELNDKVLLAQTTLQQRKKKVHGEWQDVLQRYTMGLLFQKNTPSCCRVFQSSADLQAKRKTVEVHLENLKPGELIPSRLLELVHCVYEARNVKLAKLLVKNLPDNLSFCGAQLSPVDLHVVWHLLSQTKGLKRTFSIDLRDTCVPLSGLKELVALDFVSSFRAPTMDTINLWEDLHRSSDQLSLKKAIEKFTINPLKVSQVSHVENLVVLVQIHNEKKLPLCEAEPALEDGVPAVRHLQKLEYELGQQHDPEAFLQLMKILPALQSLHHLDLENNKMGDVEAEHLAGVLSSLSSLKLLNLSQNCIGDGGVRKLSRALESASSLQSLSLYGNVIGDSGAESLASVLPLMTSLLDLDVKYNKFTDAGAKKLSAALKNSTSVKSLQYMYHVLTKNTTVTDHNRNLLVETIRSITEILIWGDQNDSSVFDFFLEKNMFAFFLNILRQKSGRYVCVQLLQTLNILFENISHETSLYYLLSNNHVNSIIVHKFDFSDEEIMAYYISFLKTLSLKLNNHTVHFFYNEHTNDFALYTEAIKFFNHPESMVRIAVRTITLNVYKVDNQHMLHYIRDKTAVPYFSNLVWFIGSHVIELDKCVQTDEEHKNRGKLSDLVAEHLDHLHYLNDILIINCEFLNDVLTDHLLNRLFLPLYVYSLVSQEQSEDRKINPQVSLYLLSQVFLIIHYQPLVNALADVILNGDLSVFTPQTEQNTHKSSSSAAVRRFTKPPESLERSLEMSRHRGRKKTQKRPNYKNVGEEDEEERGTEEGPDEEKEKAKGTDASSKASRTSGDTEEIEMVVMEKCKISDISTLTEQNITDEEKTAAAAAGTEGQRSRPFLDMVYNALDCEKEDYHALFVLCLLFAMSHSKGINPELLEKIQLPVLGQERSSYSHVLVERVIRVMNHAALPDGRVRLATLELSCLLLKHSVLSGSRCIIKDVHLACLEGAREESLHLLRRFYKASGEEIFLDMFEDEYRSMTSKPLNVEYLMMDASILLPPTGTPLTGIDFVKRLPCGDMEKTRRAIRVFFMLRALSLQLQGEPETQLPLTRPEDLIKTDDVLDLRAVFNGHVGEGNRGDEEVMGKFGVMERNLEGQMVVDFAKRMDMAVVNTYFQKREEHRVTYKSGGRRTQVDYILCRRGNLKEISDCKVVVGESVARQHRMVVCRMTLMVCKKKRSEIEIEKKTKWWKLKKEECCEEFRQKLRQALGGQVVLPDDWETTAEVIRETGRKVLGVSSGRRKEDKETWWWNEEVQDSIQRKRLQGEEVKKVQEFKYLGSTVQSNGECGKEVKKRVQAGWNGWRKVSGVLCERKISARIKGKVYRTVVRAAMLYGLETVSLRKRQESELEVAELKMLRFSLGVTRLDRIRNEYIRGTAHVGRLGDKVREARLRWFGHVQRRESSEWVCGRNDSPLASHGKGLAGFSIRRCRGQC
ncbi:hypothetical protein QTP86_022155 [Hemibagrus guttatus]|nr:hypothetical protein QTP86_022155 [Hemibagrus guttatus]